ncbi:MAG: hypothetical protein CMP10_21955 [Zetaproteobacteria bacterium]|nr:hypothetical protein [Pseudobdellovibrionaceae bacterium]
MFNMLSGFQLFIVLFFTWPVLGKELVFERVGGYHTRRPAFLSVLSTGEDKDILISSFDVPKLGNESGGLLSYFSGMNSKNDTIRVIEDFDSFLDNGGHWLDRSGVKAFSCGNIRYLLAPVIMKSVIRRVKLIGLI